MKREEEYWNNNLPLRRCIVKFTYKTLAHCVKFKLLNHQIQTKAIERNILQRWYLAQGSRFYIHYDLHMIYTKVQDGTIKQNDISIEIPRKYIAKIIPLVFLSTFPSYIILIIFLSHLLKSHQCSNWMVVAIESLWIPSNFLTRYSLQYLPNVY